MLLLSAADEAAGPGLPFPLSPLTVLSHLFVSDIQSSLCLSVSIGSGFGHCMIAAISYSLGHISFAPVFLLSLLFPFVFSGSAFFASLSLTPAALQVAAAPVFFL